MYCSLQGDRLWYIEPCSLVVDRRYRDIASITRAIIVLMIEAVSISETSDSFYQTTRRSIPKDCHPHTLATVRI
jgi:hypothetical protein